MLVLLAVLRSVCLQAQEAVTIDGPFREPVSQISFPVEFRGWSRYQVLCYPEPAGYSVTYEIRAGGAVSAIATAYVYPNSSFWPQALEEHFRSTLEQLLATDEASEPVTERLLAAGGQRCCDTWFGTMLFRRGRHESRVPQHQHEPVISFLTVARKADYWFKWRVDVLASAPREVLEDMQELIDSVGPT